MGYLLLDLFPYSCQLSPEWLKEMKISGEADQSKPDVLPDFTVVPRMVVWCFLLELPFLIVCVFVCVHDPHVTCERSRVVLPYRRVSVPVVGHFAHPQMLKRLLQRTNLNHLQKVSLWCLVQVAHLASSACCRSEFSNLAQPRSLNSVCCDIHTFLSFCCQLVAEYSGDENSAGTWNVIYSMQAPILGNIKTWNKTHKGWSSLHYLAFCCVLMPRVLILGHYNTNLHW